MSPGSHPDILLRDAELRRPPPQRLGSLLAGNRRIRDPRADPRNRSPWLPVLQRWQALRLADAFADLRARDETRLAAEFFLSDLYGDHDVSARDRDIERVLPIMQRVLPTPMLAIAADAIELAVLSHAFDLRMADWLQCHPPQRLDGAAYGDAYRAVGRPLLRRHQIGLIVAVGHALAAVVATPWVARMLRLSRFPAKAAGLGNLQSFLERGFQAYLQLPDPGAFVNTIADRELAVSAGLFAASRQAFAAPPPSLPAP